MGFTKEGTMARFFGALAVFVLLVGGAGAAEFKGKLKSVDADKGTITISLGAKDQTFTISKDTEFLVRDIRNYKPKDGLKDKVFQRKGLARAKRGQGNTGSGVPA
jgi:hypothetical protein